MFFNSPLYGLFLIVTWVIFWALYNAHRARSLMLVAASYAFYVYGTWDAARGEPVPLSPPLWALLCLGILFVGSTLDFAVARAIAKAQSRFVRSALLIASLAYYLGVLSAFKYWNFAADAVASALSMLGASVLAPHLRLVLPFGISFFTFETMSYTIDVWRGEIEPSRRYVDYLLFVCFFPHLVAGPIVRPGHMLPQLAAPPRFDEAMQARGLYRIAAGLAKKIVLGDALGRAIVDRVFATPERFTSLEVLLAVYAYAAKIYADFSGYTDVALGSAALFGYELPENFDAPYLAHNLQDFWRRWHISLSTWLRDYLYKPLGGSRGGLGKTYRNLMITMVLGGLWHGPSWTFVVWGALHGAALALTRAFQRLRRAPSPNPPSPRARFGLGRAASVFATFHFVCFAWVFFRAPTLGHAVLAFAQLGRMRLGMPHIALHVVGILVLSALVHAWPRDWNALSRERFVRAPAVVQGALLAAVALGLHWAAGARAEPFVYGQF